MAAFSFSPANLKDAFVIEGFSVEDKRGGFCKPFEKDVYKEHGISFSLNETFYSRSEKNVIRGLHFQTNNPQAKLVCVLAGKVWDVIVDLRPDSPTFKQWESFELSAENHKCIYVPRGFAHGFLSLEDDTVMLYQCDGKYDKETDTGIIFNDPEIGINWPVDEGLAIYSQRDLTFGTLKDYLASL